MENCKDEEEEEEVIVFANFEEGTVDREIFQQSHLKFKIIGLDSDTPVVQLGDTTFKGVWNDTIGTKVFFEEDTSPEPVDPVFTVVPPKMLKYKCMTTKSLEFSRIFLKPKNSDNLQSQHNTKNMLEKEAPFLPEIKGDDKILDLVQNTISPDANTEFAMADIVKQSTIELDSDNKQNDDNN